MCSNLVYLKLCYYLLKCNELFKNINFVIQILIYWAESVEALALISSKGLFSKLVADVTNSDTMMQMVTIQMLFPLSVTEHGFDYLNSIGIISGLYRVLSSNPTELDDPLISILNPSMYELSNYLKFKIVFLTIIYF